jgi:phage gp45-like
VAARIGEIDSSDEDVIKVSVNKTTKNVREVTDYVPYGIDSRPVAGLKVVLLSLREKAHKILMGIRRKPTDRVSKPGETRLYSASGSQVFLNEDGEIVIETSGGAIITMANDGNIELNGNTKSAMTFQDFETVWDAYIIHYEAHTHSNGNLGTPTGSIITPLAPTDKDMSDAENDKVVM